jgi:hypothetical protein
MLLVLAIGMLGSAVAAADTDEQSIFAWKKWKSIEAAIVLRNLDGPEDILEKAEIIEDRIDMFNREKAALNKSIAVHRRMADNLKNQREVLRDLSEIRQGGDFQTQQRLHEIAEQIQQEEHLLALRKSSVADLDKELNRLKRVFAAYKKKAQQLQIKESNAL